MATIEKEKALDVVRQMVADGQVSQEVAEKYFPELKSEDERIRKGIIRNLEYLMDRAEGFVKDELKERIAWLEKQCEHANFRNKIQIGDKVTRNEDGVLVNLSQLNRVAKKQGEQKPADTEKGANGNEREIPIPEPPLTIKHAKEVMGTKQNDAWSKEDEEHIMAIDLAVNRCDGKWNCCGEKCPISEHNPWLKSLKERVQPKQEWSEEDEYCRHQLIVFCENCMVKDDGAKRCAHWLKSFKERYTWKPSDEQMKILNEVLNFAANHESPHWNDYIFGTLNNLIRQLKKL